MANSDPNDNTSEKGVITITDQDGNVREKLEIVNVRSGDEIQEGSFVVEVREVKK